MVRRLINPLNTSLNKKSAYLVLLVVDVIAAGTLFEPTPLGLNPAPRYAAFCLVHLLVCLLLTNAITPWRESLQSWVWRFRGRLPHLWDLWQGERSESMLSVLTFCLMGGVGLFLLVLLPQGMEEGFAKLEASQALGILGVTTLLLMTLGTVYQWFISIAGRSAKGAFLTFLMILIVPFHILGYYYQINLLLALSPSAHFLSWFQESPPPALLPLFVAYGGLLVLMWWSLRRRVARMSAVVDEKLVQMGVVKRAG
jgi:hypothetical protein